MKKFSPWYTLVLLLGWTAMSTAQSPAKVPGFEEVLSLRQPGSPQISPDGRHIAFTVRTIDWKNNRFDSEIWLSKDGQPPFQLTRTPNGSSSGPAWSPDGKWIAFTARRGEKNQLFTIRADGGEAQALTNAPEDVQGFEWSPDGTKIAFTMAQKEDKPKKNRQDRYGAFAEEDEEYRLSGLYWVEFLPDRPGTEELPCYDEKDPEAQTWDCLKWPEIHPLIDSVEFTVRNFFWSPDGTRIAFTHQPDPLITSSLDADIALLEVTSRKITPLVQNPSADQLLGWSPDGKELLYDSDELDRTSNYYKNSKLFRISTMGGSPTRIAKDFDENLYGLIWTAKGIYASASQKTEQHLFLIDPISGTVRLLQKQPSQISSFSITPDGSTLAFLASDSQTLPEVYRMETGKPNPKAITDFSAQIKGWKTAQSEVISWKSTDSAIIEGVLHKPSDYDPSRAYPLLVVIHGGPTGVDRPAPVPGSVYPIVQWLNKGALVLRVNYRGSAGYGEAFRSLNVRNLGVGDAWDVLSGIDFLAGKGLIDTTRMGAMGWSQGGYISAFLTTTTNRFKAISVGAGISNWMTYYVNTDIHPFTRQYLQATPWDDEAIYKKTSPMTYINMASTPTLIQHGEFDRRVPIPNAYELYQGLQDVGVETSLIVYKGFGHGIDKPKERLAAMWHNWQWFNRYLWKEEVELPIDRR